MRNCTSSKVHNLKKVQILNFKLNKLVKQRITIAGHQWSLEAHIHKAKHTQVMSNDGENCSPDLD